MKIELPKLNCSRGAPMGRMNKPVNGKCHLQIVPLYDGCYDKGGAYWGMGTPLYVCQDKEKNLFFVRANNRTQAKEKVKEHNKNVTFFR